MFMVGKPFFVSV